MATLETMTLEEVFENYNVLENGNIIRENENERLNTTNLEETNNFKYIKVFDLKIEIDEDEDPKTCVTNILTSLSSLDYAKKLRIIYIENISNKLQTSFASYFAIVDTECLSVHLLTFFEGTFLVTIENENALDEFKEFLGM